MEEQAACASFGTPSLLLTEVVYFLFKGSPMEVHILWVAGAQAQLANSGGNCIDGCCATGLISVHDSSGQLLVVGGSTAQHTLACLTRNVTASFPLSAVALLS